MTFYNMKLYVETLTLLFQIAYSSVRISGVNVEYWPFLIALGFMWILTLTVSGFRYQLYGAVIAVLLIFIAYEFSVAAYVYLPLTIGSLILCLLLPVFVTPPLFGPYKKIAVASFDVKDPSRPRWDLYGDKSGIRQLWFRVFYPTVESATGTYSQYLPDILHRGKYFTKDLGLPSFMFNHFVLSKTRAIQQNSSEDIKIADGKHPLVLLSHGYNSSMEIHTILCQHLASHGYIVASVQHSFDALITYFPSSGESFPFNASPPVLRDENHFWEFRGKHLDIRARDLLFVLDLLTGQKKAESVDFSQFTASVDMNRIYAVGQSFGACTAIQSAVLDQRIKKVVGFDGWITVLSKETKQCGVKVPLLLLQAGPRFYVNDNFWSETNDSDCVSLIKNSPEPSTLVRLEGVKHLEFTDANLFSPVVSQLLGISGPLPGSLLQKIMFDYTYRFLKDQANTEFDGHNHSHPKIYTEYPQQKLSK
ncbi:hypothetical protein MIR68_001729 [Amoeboaphelidium protococcarum]|nr:hypothetical protein MIR68_001729 [Amoeboaphelidium protococcarum]